MTTMMQAYCGLDCAECPAYIAKQTDDQALRINTAEKWNGPNFPVTADDINCDGCKTTGGAEFRFCTQCPVRSCASPRDVQTCAHCADFICDTLEHWMQQAGEDARTKLEKIHESF
jgi:hypothetical protein